MTNNIQGNSHKVNSRFLSRNSTGQKEVGKNVSSVERKELSMQILYLVKLSFRNEREIKTFSDERKLKITSRPTLKEQQKRILQTERKL